jgi:hypothetical protein
LADKTPVAFPATAILSHPPKKFSFSALVKQIKTDKERGMSSPRMRCQSDRGLVLVSRIKKQLILKKGKQKFIFRYESGCEDKLLDVLIEQAKSGRTDFDWFDAAVLSFKLTQSLIGQADELIGDKVNVKQ